MIIGRERAGKRSTPDRIEKEKDDFFHRVRKHYLEMAEHYPHRICTVDASVPLEEVKKQVKKQLYEYNVLS